MKDLADYCKGISGQIDEHKKSDELEYRRTTDLCTTDMEWLNLELYALLAIKTADTALSSHQVTRGS